MTGQYFHNEHGFALLAHRGLALPDSGVVENTLRAFSNALTAGATHIETDVQATKDGVAVLFHDKTLLRLTGDQRRVSQVTFDEMLSLCAAQGFEPLSLDQAFQQLPHAKFNLDVKSWDAVASTAHVINEHAAHGRVLVSSFSDARRLATLALLQASVATSAGSSAVLKARFASSIGAKRMLRVSLLGVDALQLPISMYGVRFDSAPFVKNLRALGLEVHFWTVNSPNLARRLLRIGATGLVSDRVDLLAPLLGKG